MVEYASNIKENSMLIEIEYSDTQYTTSSDSAYIEVQIESNITKLHKSNLVSRELPKPRPIHSYQESDVTDIDTLLSETESSDVLRNRYMCENEDVMRLLSQLSCDSQQATRQSMMNVYSQFLDWSQKSMFERCDEFLYLVNVESLDIRLLISILMASNPMRNLLSYRNSFFTKVRNEANSRYGLVEAAKILQGLK